MTPDTIEHNGKALVRLPRIEDAREGDYVMISNELFPVARYDGDLYVLSGLLSRFLRVIQAQYREKAEVHDWINTAHMNEYENYVVNNILTERYGSPAELMRKGAEQAIILMDEEWEWVQDFYLRTISQETILFRLVTQSLANCRPKGGAK